MTRIAVATENASVAGHFGHCPTYRLYDVASGLVTAVEEIANPGHEAGFPPDFLASVGAQVVIAGGIGAVLAVIATMMGVSLKPPSVEQYSQDMLQCADQIKTGQATTACSPEVATQAQDIARDSDAIAAATKSEQNPNGLDVVYWIAPEAGAAKSADAHVFHLCEKVSALAGKVVHSGSVTQAYSENAIRITKQIDIEQKQCGFAPAA